MGLTDVEIRKANKQRQLGSSDDKINSKFKRKSLDSSQWRVNSISSAFPLPRQLIQRRTGDGHWCFGAWANFLLITVGESSAHSVNITRGPHSSQQWSPEGRHRPQTWEQTLGKTSVPQLLSCACYCCQHNCQTVVCPVQDLAFTDAW